ncbi:MAG: type pilus assembly protein PilA [Chthoniobacter sp.]|jgi:prepilin-type N-terminal cleavage/methylation domain-containing protein|nr:type pilus assembly protein PilA [Chthoniobacter sp.]
MKKNHLRTAFTLIELLVVISIIAILAGIGLPAMQGALLNAKITAAMGKAKQIGIALRLYSNDHEGAYPGGKDDKGDAILTANDAFRTLIPTYLDTESVFFVGGSKAGPLADNRIGSPSEILEAGENHWAYVSGLSGTSNSSWPVIVDHTDGSGYYTEKENTLGGTWKGTKAVVIRTDGSGSMPKLLGTGDKHFIPRADDKTKNALSTDYMGDDVKLLEPAR